jgi:hypothetical protein
VYPPLTEILSNIKLEKRSWRNAIITTSLERAKRFIAQKAHKLALAAVPLAALAVSMVPAHAGSLTPGTCNAFTNTSGSGVCFYGAAGVGGSVGDVTWMQMAGSGFTTSGGFLDFGNSGSGVGTGTIAAETIPVSWLLSVSGSNLAADPVSFFLQIGVLISVSGGATNEFSFFQSGSWSTAGNQSGSGTFAVPSGSIVGWDMTLSTSDSTSAYSINIPGGSTVDLNPASTATPEPGSILLMGAGGAAMLFLRRRKKA